MLKDFSGQVIQLQGSLLGFKQLNEFLIQSVDDEGMFAYLQSQEDEQVGFVVTSPFSFYKDYSFELDPATIEDLGTKTQEDVMVMAIITLQEPFKSSTVNLLAPIVFNIKNGIARQLVLPPHHQYTTKMPLNKPKVKEEEVSNVDLNT